MAEFGCRSGGVFGGRRFVSGPAAGLALALGEVLAQRFGQPLLPAPPVGRPAPNPAVAGSLRPVISCTHALSPRRALPSPSIVRAAADGVKPGFGAVRPGCLRGLKPCGILRPLSIPPRCRRSSGVERALGKGEVECSIHSGGTIINSRPGLGRGIDFLIRCPLAVLLRTYSRPLPDGGQLSDA